MRLLQSYLLYNDVLYINIVLNNDIVRAVSQSTSSSSVQALSKTVGGILKMNHISFVEVILKILLSKKCTVYKMFKIISFYFFLVLEFYQSDCRLSR